MNTNQLRYFVAAAECRSFTKAADQFYITQTAITQQIHALEDSLGVPLFDRTSRPITLTPAGSAFLKIHPRPDRPGGKQDPGGFYRHGRYTPHRIYERV